MASGRIPGLLAVAIGCTPRETRIPRQHIEFIRRISRENPSWGEDRIALEMRLKLGIKHAASTVRRYMAVE